MALRNSGVGAIVGYCALLGGYAVAGLTKPLVITRSLDKIATQRLIETSQFVYDVYMSEGMGRFSDGFISTLRVRMLHAMVRYKLSHSDWDMERWGLPINQVDLGATLLAFTVINLMGQRMLGMVIPPSEGRDFMHLWRYVGFLQGVADKYNPATEWEALRLVPVLLGTQEGPDADGRALAKSLLNTRYDWWPKNLSGQAAARVELELASVFTRLLAGEDTGDQLGLPKNALAYGVVALLPPVNLLREAWRLAIPGATARAEASGKANFRREMDRLLGGKRTQFAHHRS
jgi:hypothetical protein